ncbi:hypothetical protein CIB84_014088, partial [Bambusicola thoracicus]
MAAGLGPWLLALALGPAGVCAQFKLEASGGGVRAPGDSVQLSCQGSGFSFGNYDVLWYRQTLGGHLEWLSYISWRSYIRYSPDMEGRATVSRDNSLSVSYLSLFWQWRERAQSSETPNVKYIYLFLRLKQSD